MRSAIWIPLAWIATAVATAAAEHVLPAHLLPDAAIVAITFLALRCEAIPVALVALALGYLNGRQAVAPVGLHETAFVASSIAVFAVSGRIVGSGALFFAAASGGAVAFYHLALFLLSWLFRSNAGFASLSAALLLPNAVATALLALAVHPLMIRLDQRLSPDRREGLQWR